ncbi:MAG: hypothetical protein Q8O55_04135 [Dehalococcoidales bacterium]|nr:hypothetical protein [Dehalococcoidales bacterium]
MTFDIRPLTWEGEEKERLSENKESLICHSVLDTESRSGDEVVWILAPVSGTGQASPE